MTFDHKQPSPQVWFDFDLDGPRFGPFRLLAKSRLGFSPRSPEDLAVVFEGAHGPLLDLARLEVALAHIADAMNKGEIALAAVATSRLPLPAPDDEPQAADQADGLRKAGVDDPEHPGYPAGTPDGKGGEFRPKEPAGGAGSSERAERLKRLAARKTFRSIASRVLSAKRIMRMIGRYVEGEVVEDIPVVNDAVGAASMKDDLDLMLDIAKDVADSDAAIDFVNKGPFELGELQQSPTMPQSFRSFDEFKKDEIEKQFGPAGEGFDYHHIVEQGPNAGVFTQEQLQSTENIVRIPRLLHEELNSVYGTLKPLDGKLVSPRAYLRGRSFEAQRQFGIEQLRSLGVLH